MLRSPGNGLCRDLELRLAREGVPTLKLPIKD